jgi:antitoxin (DNA-binding transcriptional repressor) of toxin-antitoxin stability system
MNGEMRSSWGAMRYYLTHPQRAAEGFMSERRSSMSTQTKVLDVREAQTQLAELLTLVKTGSEVMISENSTIVARLAPVKVPVSPRRPGLHAGAIWVSDDFDAPLPDALWAGEA